MGRTQTLTEQDLLQPSDYLDTVSTALHTIDHSAIAEATWIIRETRLTNSRVWIVGNGGSASTASHFANDLIKMGRINATSIPDMVPTILAFGNDIAWEDMFAEILKRSGRRNDVLVAISCSGRSPNVLKAVKVAAMQDQSLVILTGSNMDNPLDRYNVDAKIFVESDDIKVQEDCHLAICHAIAGALAKDFE